MSTTWSLASQVTLTNMTFQNVASDSTGQYLVAVGSDINGTALVIYASSNNGKSFKSAYSITGGSTFNSVASSYSGQNLIVANSNINGNSSYYITSSNYGRTWSNLNNFPQYYYVFSVASDSTGQNLVVVGSSGNGGPGVYTSINGGSSWTAATATGLPTNVIWKSVASDSTGQKLIIANNLTSSYVYTSTNGGTSWTQANIPSSYWNYVASDSTGQYLIASASLSTVNGQVVSTAYIYTSTNGGSTWVNQTSAINNLLNITLENYGGQYPLAASSGNFFVNIGNWMLSLPFNSSTWSVILNSLDLSTYPPFIVCNQAGSEIFVGSGETLVTFTSTTTPITKKYKTKTTTTSYVMKGRSRLEVASIADITRTDLAFIMDPTGSYYQLATVAGVGSIYIYESLNQSYPAGSSIYIYPPNTTISEILAEQNLPVPADICFTKNTPIQTDQGIIAIQKIDPAIHSINNKKIIAITKSISMDNYLICFEKHALGENIPSTRTIVTKYHKIKNKHGKMIQAYKYLDYFDHVKKIDYNGEILYNILMEEHETVNVNNLICETLHPEHEIAKLYASNYTDDYKNTVVVLNNYSKKQNNTKTYQKSV